MTSRSSRDRLNTADELARRVIEPSDFVADTEAFIDVRIPGSAGKAIYSMIGPGVSQKPRMDTEVAAGGPSALTVDRSMLDSDFMGRLRGLLLIAGLAVAVACGDVRIEDTGRPGTDVVAGPTSTAITPSTTTTLTGDTVEPTSTTWSSRSFTMAFTGDFLLHNRVNATAASAADDVSRDYDYEPLLAALEPLLTEVDWAVCHMEVSLSADNTRLRSFPVFRAPGDIARDARRIGYDSCTTASNHVLDHGSEGVAETLGVLDDAGLGHTGSARSADEAVDDIWIDVGGVRVAHLSYSYGFNGFTIPGDMPWLTNLIDEARILSDASRARRKGAEYVVLSLHWGEQYIHAPNWQQRELGPRLLASPDVDLVIGHHAHVVQPIDRIDGEWLVYGLGNLLSAQASPARRDELLVRVEVTERVDGTFATDLQAVPLYLDRATLTVHRSNPTTRSPLIDPTMDAKLDASWSRVLEVLQAGTGWTELTVG